MEVNRYLIAALYVMAGCAIMVPQKAQGEGAVVERCRVIITQTVRTLAVSVEQSEKKQIHRTLSAQKNSIQVCGDLQTIFFISSPARIELGTLCRTAHKIRAPEC